MGIPFRTTPGRNGILLIVMTWIALSMPSLRAADVTTQHNDNSRTGANLSEPVLNTANVNASTFGKLFSRNVDGHIYAKPLYVSNVTIPGQGVHKGVNLCTQRTSWFAF